MHLLRRRAYARTGLVGNPSDGYNGRTISLIVKNYWAEAVLYEWDDLELVLGAESTNRFGSIHELVRDVKLHGYYGGIRLVKAAIKKFAEYCVRQKIDLHDRNFSVRFGVRSRGRSAWPGRAPSSSPRCGRLMDYYGVSIPLEVQPSLALSVEVEELGIAAGLQDRVIQVYEGLVSMDFGKDAMRGRTASSTASTSRSTRRSFRQCIWRTRPT
ncbi:MAG: hypothetical protein U0746_03995 [Gemmataceae bacterium]